MSRFHQDWSPLYRDAVHALVALAAKEEGNAVRAFADATAERKREWYLKQTGTKVSAARACLHRLLGKRCPQTYPPYATLDHQMPCHPPGDDHPTLMLKAGKPYQYISQPYDLSLRTMREIVDFCERWGLDVYFSGYASWYFPGEAIALVYARSKS